ncbi:glycine zipper 2TM domain-containing protein [Ancylobacter oerskovii]|nr:glycine zipper 2TM domain-containing protein [Ancylobacter oerskovii]
MAGLAGFSHVPAQAQNSTATGAIIGGVTGAVIGGAVTGRGTGALVGGAIGAGTGAVIGSQADRNRNRYREFYFWRGGNCYLQQSNGRVVRVHRHNCR